MVSGMESGSVITSPGGLLPGGSGLLDGRGALRRRQGSRWCPGCRRRRRQQREGHGQRQEQSKELLHLLHSMFLPFKKIAQFGPDSASLLPELTGTLYPIRLERATFFCRCSKIFYKSVTWPSPPAPKRGWRSVSKKPRRVRARRREKMEICFPPGTCASGKHFSARKCGISPPTGRTDPARSGLHSCSKKRQSRFFDSLGHPRPPRSGDGHAPYSYFLGRRHGGDEEAQAEAQPPGQVQQGGTRPAAGRAARPTPAERPPCSPAATGAWLQHVGPVTVVQPGRQIQPEHPVAVKADAVLVVIGGQALLHPEAQPQSEDQAQALHQQNGVAQLRPGKAQEPEAAVSAAPARAHSTQASRHRRRSVRRSACSSLAQAQGRNPPGPPPPPPAAGAGWCAPPAAAR